MVYVQCTWSILYVCTMYILCKAELITCTWLCVTYVRMYNSHSIKTVVLIVHAGVQVRLKKFFLG